MPLLSWRTVATLVTRPPRLQNYRDTIYFTALVKSSPQDSAQSQRQQIYIRALETIPSLSVHYGRFLQGTRKRWLATPPAHGGPREVDILHREEKGSDVNLATHLLVDGFEGDFDVAVLITNDSDLIELIRVVRSKLGRDVGVLNPHRNTSYALRGVASFYRPVPRRALAACQFPPSLTDVRGTITKPHGW